MNPATDTALPPRRAFWQRLARVRFRHEIEHLDAFAGIHAGIDYLVTPVQLDNVLQRQLTSGRRLLERVPDEDAERTVPRREWTGERLSGARVAFHHAGGLGDDLVYGSALRRLVERHPGVTIRAFTLGTNYFTSVDNPDIGARPIDATVALPLAALERYDAWILPGDLSHRTRGTSTSIYEHAARAAGLTAFGDGPVHPEPFAWVTQMDRDQLESQLAAVPDGFWDRLIVVGLHASESRRSPTDWYERLTVLQKAVGGGWYFAVVADEQIMRAEMGGRPAIPGVFLFPYRSYVPSLNARGLMVLTERARLALCPDTFLAHAAAITRTPTLALWNMGSGGHMSDELFERESNPMYLWARREARRRNVLFDGLPIDGDGAPTSQIPPPEARIGTYPAARALDMASDHATVRDAALELLA